MFFSILIKFRVVLDFKKKLDLFVQIIFEYLFLEPIAKLKQLKLFCFNYHFKPKYSKGQFANQYTLVKTKKNILKNKKYKWREEQKI